MGNKMIVENFIHNCDEKKVEYSKYKKEIVNIYNTNETKKIYLTYLNEFEETKGKIYEKYGWKGTGGKCGLNKLEGLLLNSAKIQKFCIKKSSSIKNTLKQMDLSPNKMCIKHPRVVLNMTCKIEFTEDNKTNIRPSETRLQCLFRHIRNALAHNLTYDFENGKIMLEDKFKNNITACLLLSKKTLIDWIGIIKKNNK